MIDRRAFITTAALSGALGRSAFAQPARSFSQDFAPILSTPEREIRTVVGLRPYRRTGFVSRSEKIGRRMLVHNYGHGGCGVTMSWGCAELAVERAAASRERRAAVVGAGVIGLTTAHRLLRRGYDVTIYAAALPPHTTSNIAAAFWRPTSLFSRSAVNEAFLLQFRRAARLSQRTFQHLANDRRYGVSWMRFFRFSDQKNARDSEPAYEGDDLYPGKTLHTAPERTFGFAQALTFHAMMIDPDFFLRALMQDIDGAGGRIVERRFESRSEILDLKEKLIFNCTGLGARSLFGDEELTPVRGQLTMLLPQPEIDYGYIYQSTDGLLYMFPRRGAIVLGGSYEQGVWSTEPNAEDRLRMLNGHAAVAEQIAA